MPTEPLSPGEKPTQDSTEATDSGTPNAEKTSVSRSQTVVRFVKTPFHLNANKTRLRPGAFRPPAGSDEVSVVQQNFRGDDYCKQVAVSEIPEENYHGLAPGIVGAILDAGAKAVVDSPDVFPGHADIITPHASAKDEPLSAEKTQELDKFVEALVKHFHYYPDPDKSSPGWTGPALARTS